MSISVEAYDLILSPIVGLDQICLDGWPWSIPYTYFEWQRDCTLNVRVSRISKLHPYFLEKISLLQKSEKGSDIHIHFEYEGEVLAKQLASLGAKLILSARNEAELERVKTELSGILPTLVIGAHAFNAFKLQTYSLCSISSFCFVLGKHAPNEVKILPLDLASGEDSLREAVEKAEAFFPGQGVDYMIHNAAFERPVCKFVNFDSLCPTL